MPAAAKLITAALLVALAITGQGAHRPIEVRGSTNTTTITR